MGLFFISKNNIGFKLFCVLVMMWMPFVFMAFRPTAAYGTSEYSAEQLLAILKAKDEQFDNALLRMTTSGVIEMNLPADAGAGGWDGEPYTIRFQYDENLAVRGGETTLDRTLVPDSVFVESAIGDRIGGGRGEYQKWSHIGSLSRDYSSTGGAARGDRVMEISAGGLPVDVAEEDRMFREFSLGFGYGKRIKSIDAIERDGELLVVRGSIQIWWADESTFEIRLDDDFVVRQALIESDVEGNKTRFEIQTEGTAEDSSGMQIAQSGEFTRTSLGFHIDGRIVGQPKIAESFNVEFQELKLGLSDSEYESFTSFPMELGTQVINNILGTVHFSVKPILSINSFDMVNMPSLR